MGAYFSKYYFRGPFVLFGLPHLAALSFILLINLIIYRHRHRFTFANRRHIRWLLAAILLGFQSGWVIWLFAVDEANLRTALPLHLCNLMVLISSVMLITNSRILFEYTYFLGSGGALVALITPDLTVYGFPHFLFFLTFIVHGSLLTAQVFMVFAENFRPTYKSLLKAFIAVNLYIPIIAPVNKLLSSNYLFLTAKPDSPTILDHLGSPPWYYIWVELIMLFVFFLLFLPFILKKRQNELMLQ